MALRILLPGTLTLIFITTIMSGTASGTASGSGSGKAVERSSSDAADKVKKARDTLSSIYSFYANNRDSVDNVPLFVRESGEEIAMTLDVGTVPSAEQTEELKKQLKELIGTQETINNIPAKERQAMVEAANASTIRRKGGAARTT